MSTLPAYVTDATRLLLEDDYPVVDNENAGLRKTGQSKLAIPNGDLAKYVPDWLAKPGVVRHLLDTLTAEEGQALFESLAHPDETTTEARQVRLEDQALIKNQKEQWLEKRAAALLVRAFPAIYGNPAENQDAILTHAGFRAGACHPSLTGARDAFIVRLIGLQLLIRRGIEIRTLLDTQDGEQRFPLYGYTDVETYNTGSWNDDLAGAEPPGTAVKQTLSRQQQRDMKRQRDPPTYNGDTDNEPNYRALYNTLKERYDRRTANDDDEHQNKRRKTGNDRDVHPNIHPNMPNHAFPTTAIAKKPTLSLEDADTILQRPEVDPCDCVDARVVPEIVTKFNSGATITAGYIHGLICPSDQRQTMSIIDGDDGAGFTVATGSTSTKKITTIYDILAVTDAYIDSVASVQPMLGVKLRQSFPRALHRAHRRFHDDAPKTVAYWDRHIASWAKGLTTGANISLDYSKGYADYIDEEMTATRAETKKDDAYSAQVKQLQRQYAKLQRQLAGAPTTGTQGGGGGGGGGKPRHFPNAADQDCVNFIAGKDCKILDDDGNCIFRHTGLVKGSDPEAIRKRYDKLKS